jgi:hypothetical protein
MRLLLFPFDRYQMTISGALRITTQKTSALIRVPSAQSASGFLKLSLTSDQDHSAETDTRRLKGQAASSVNCEIVSLIEEILAPLLVGAADHAHDVTAGVQAEGAGLAHESHIDFA